MDEPRREIPGLPDYMQGGDKNVIGTRGITRQDVIDKINAILAEGLKFQEFIHFADKETVQAFLKEYPEYSRYRFASFFRFFDRAMPVKVLHKTDRGDRITPEQIAKMNLTPKELMRLAGVGEPDDAGSSDK